jgi:CRP/FNR family transcriptional regulator, cyclic AMP receptor protein
VTTINIFKNSAHAADYEPGQMVFKEGDACDVMYAVVEGSVAIEREGRVIETVGEGGIFGELSLIEQGARNASATTLDASRLVPVDQKQFMRLVQDHPTFALQVMKIMAERIRNANQH